MMKAQYLSAITFVLLLIFAQCSGNKTGNNTTAANPAPYSTDSTGSTTSSTSSSALDTLGTTGAGNTTL